MDCDYKNIPVSELCSVIDMLNTSMDDYMYVYDIENDFYYISQHAMDRFYMTKNGFHNVFDTLQEEIVYEKDIDLLLEELEEDFASDKDEHNLQYRWLDKNRQPVWINCRGRIVRDNGKAIYMAGCINELGDKRKADNISGFLGETSLRNYVNDMVKRDVDGFILRLGLDEFKSINEKYGMEYGDKILRMTAETIEKCLQDGQQVYRIVADEFIVLDFTGRHFKEAVSLYKDIRHRLDQYTEKIQYDSVITVSAGVVPYFMCQEKSYAEMMRLSEFSVNEAKRQGRNRCYIFMDDDYEVFLKKKNLTDVIRQCVRDNFRGFEAHFQPLYHIETRQLYGAETLMRFQCEEFGRISPAEFIPILEETGLIIPAGRWILYQAMTACKKFQEIVPNFKISVNVSYVQIVKSDIMDEIEEAVQEYGLEPSTLIVELTESGILDANKHFAKVRTKLKQNGILLALDDFGTGYSNFQYLYNMCPDIIKFDRSFTVKAVTNDFDNHLLNLMSSMARELHMKVCIEGIETEDELECISKMEPDYSQGYYFGRPCSFDEFVERYLKPDTEVAG